MEKLESNLKPGTSVFKREIGVFGGIIVLVGMLFNVLVILSVFIYRKKYPNIDRPYKTWGYPVTVIITVLIFVGLMINTFIEDPVTALIGFIVPVIGIFFYIYFDKRNTCRSKIEKYCSSRVQVLDLGGLKIGRGL